MEEWTKVIEGKTTTFTYQKVARDQTQMTATVDGENSNRLEKGGLKHPLSHEDVEKQFPQVIFQKKTK